MKITKKLARHIELFDDETPTGGKAFCDEMLDEFMESVGIPFGTSLKKVNEGLVECGIEPVTKEQVLNVTHPFTDSQIRLLRRIAKYTKMDCWFDIDEKGQIRDLENNSRPMNPRRAMSDFMDGINSDTFNQLNDKEKFDLLMAVSNVIRPV